jgi:hypothetical protein
VFVVGNFSAQWLSLEKGAQDFLATIWGNIEAIGSQRRVPLPSSRSCSITFGDIDSEPLFGWRGLWLEEVDLLRHHDKRIEWHRTDSACEGKISTYTSKQYEPLDRRLVPF